MSTEKRKARLLESRTKEKDEAAAWLSDHPGMGAFPGKRAENGESDDGRDRIERERSGARGLRHLSMDIMLTQEAWEEWHIAHGARMSLVSGAHPALTPEQAVLRARVAALFEFMLPEHVELLLRYHGNRETQDELAEEHGVTRQAIQQRLRVAEEDFRRVFADHWEDENELW